MQQPADSTFTTRRLARFIRAVATIAAIGGAVGAEAANMSLDPTSTSASTGSQVSFDLLADFGSTVMLGGAVDIGWNDAVLHFAGFTYDPGIAPPRRDTSFDVVDLQNSQLVSIGFGNFAGISLPATTTIGKLTFDVVGNGGASTELSMTGSDKWSQGVFFTVSGADSEATYAGAQFSVTPSAVPLPGSQWLLLGALSGLGAVVRRRKFA